MNKDILYEHLYEDKKAYEDFFEKNSEKLHENAF